MVEEPLRVVVDGTRIIGTMLGTDFSVTYQKQFGSPHLVLTHTSITASGPAPVTEFASDCGERGHARYPVGPIVAIFIALFIIYVYQPSLFHTWLHRLFY